MKTRLSVCTLPVFWFFILVCLMLSGCSTVGRMIVQEDEVYSAKRYELRYWCRDHDLRSPLLSLEQHMVKQVDDKGSVTVKNFDVLYLTSSGYNLENKVFFLMDGAVYPMKINQMEQEYSRSISNQTSSVQTSDSTSVTVATGFSENNQKIFRFSYSLSDDALGKIKTSRRVLLRYYAGPSMITVPMNKRYLRKIRRMLVAGE